MIKCALQIYHCFHLFIPEGGDERDVQIYSHSQGDWEILKHKKGLLWTLPISLLDGRIENGKHTTCLQNKLDTPEDLWQFASGYGFMPVEI